MWCVYFLKLLFTYLMESHREKNKQKISICCFTPQEDYSSQSWARLRPGVSSMSPMWVTKGPNTYTIFCFSLAIKRELDWKWRSQNHCPCGMLISQVVAFLPIPHYWPLHSFFTCHKNKNLLRAKSASTQVVLEKGKKCDFKDESLIPSELWSLEKLTLNHALSY